MFRFHVADSVSSDESVRNIIHHLRCSSGWITWVLGLHGLHEAVGPKNSFSPHGFLLFAVWIGEVCGVFEWKVTKADVF